MSETAKNNLMMILRYTFAIAMTAAVQRGWLHVESVDAATAAVVEVIGQMIAWGPAVYAAIFVKNTPKPAASSPV